MGCKTYSRAGMYIYKHIQLKEFHKCFAEYLKFELGQEAKWSFYFLSYFGGFHCLFNLTTCVITQLIAWKYYFLFYFSHFIPSILNIVTLTYTYFLQFLTHTQLCLTLLFQLVMQSFSTQKLGPFVSFWFGIPSHLSTLIYHSKYLVKYLCSNYFYAQIKIVKHLLDFICNLTPV